jgi:hypothetical protein
MRSIGTASRRTTAAAREGEGTELKIVVSAIVDVPVNWDTTSVRIEKENEVGAVVRDALRRRYPDLDVDVQSWTHDEPS